MKRLLLILAAAVLMPGAAGAQGIWRMTTELARADIVTGAAVEVNVADDAARAVDIAGMNHGRTSLTIYGIGIFRDNSQDGRGNAQAAKARFSEMYPGIDVRLTYENPWFWVTAGNFFDRMDAVALCGRVVDQFPQAVIRQQEISIAEFIAREKNEPESEPGTAGQETAMP